MSCIIINGFSKGDLLRSTIHNAVKDYGIDENAEWIDLQGIGYCKGCDCCHKVNPGVCAVNDGLNELLRKYMNSEQVVIVSPVIFGCLNSSVKNFIDRTQPLFMPLQASKSGKTIMKGRYEKYPDLVFQGNQGKRKACRTDTNYRCNSIKFSHIRKLGTRFSYGIF